MKQFRRIAWVSVVVAIVALMAIYGWQKRSSEPAATNSQVSGNFSLVNSAGNTVTDKDFRGQWLLVFFGFTHCPDVCPLTLGKVAQVMKALGPQAEKVQPLFITVDPERDTPEVMRKYTAIFYPKIIGLTGTNEKIQEAILNFKAYSAKIEDEGNHGDPDHAGHDYSVNHSAHLYLINPQGDFLTAFSSDEEAKEITDGILINLQK